jgi:hypothetical protein
MAELVYGDGPKLFAALPFHNVLLSHCLQKHMPDSIMKVLIPSA